MESANMSPKNANSLGVLGYLIVSNKQVHSYQMQILNEYLEAIGLKLQDTVLDAIIRGSDDSISFLACAQAFSEESQDVQCGIYYTLIALACVDNHVDDEEESVINHILNISSITEEQANALKASALSASLNVRKENNTVFLRPDFPERKKTLLERIKDWFINIWKRLTKKKEEGTEDILQNSDDNDDYEAAIKKSTEIAYEDFELVSPSYNRLMDACKETLESINSYRKTLSLETGISAEVASCLSLFADSLKNEVEKDCEREHFAFKQKERTLSDFTISLIGRTKAGKSTLHSILTNQGHDRIGIGKQRTTRYNWVYQWNMLRIIDTPGIGSSEADGRVDENIAKSILGESDVICFLVVDDSILKDVLDFVSEVAKLNKPIIILLHHKENIRDGVRFEEYIKNPKLWLSDAGESSLKGHENRIRNYAKENGFDSLIQIYPVFLLPALMAMEEEYKEYGRVLWESSNIDVFIEKLKEWITQTGCMKRSQTIIDETIQVFASDRNKVFACEEILEKQITFMDSECEHRIPLLHSYKEETIKKIHARLTERYNVLAHSDALLFAEEIYGHAIDIDKQFSEYLERIGFVDEIKAIIDSEISTYKDKVDTQLRELFEDFAYSARISFDMGKIDIPIQVDLKNILRWANAGLGVLVTVLGLAGLVAPPVAIATGLIGAGISYFISKLPTKGILRQRGVNRIYESLSESLEKKTPSLVDEAVEAISAELSKNADNIEHMLNELRSGLLYSKNLSDKLADKYDEEIVLLNRMYAGRILKFLSDETVDDRIIKSVDRSKSGVITIQTEGKSFLGTEKLEGVIAEKVSILTI